MHSPTETYIFDSKRISLTLVTLAEEHYKNPDSRRYISLHGLVKVKNKLAAGY